MGRPTRPAALVSAEALVVALVSDNGLKAHLWTAVAVSLTALALSLAALSMAIIAISR